MSNQSAAGNVHPFMHTSSAPNPNAPDPLPILRREVTLLRIEMENLSFGMQKGPHCGVFLG
jgi:hypothetical protein